MLRRILFVLYLILFVNIFGQTTKFDSTFQIHGGVDYYLGTQLTNFDQEIVPVYVSHNRLNSTSINLSLTPVQEKSIQLRRDLENQNLLIKTTLNSSNKARSFS